MIETIYLIPHTHTDLGYTDRVENVLCKQTALLDEALDLCSHGSDAFSPETYRWTIESACILRHWWDTRGPDQQKKAERLLRNGQWQLMGFETQLLTELSRPLELQTSVKWACELGKSLGFAVQGVMLNDIGGYARGLPSALAPQGIRYLVGGVGGFRVLLPWADLPCLFNWQSPDGQSLLMWHLGVDPEQAPTTFNDLPAQYGFGYNYCFWPIKRQLQANNESDPSACDDKAMDAAWRRSVEHGLHEDASGHEAIDIAWRKLEQQLARRGYPYKQLMLQCAGDNDGIDRDAPYWVEQWNKQIECPKIRIATPAEFFHDLLKDVPREEIPKLSGTLHDPWNDHAPTHPPAYAQYRNNGRRLDALHSNAKSTASLQSLDNAIQQQLWFSDHTFGLSMWDYKQRICMQLNQGDIHDPKMKSWIESWADKHAYPIQAAQHIAAAEAQQWPQQSLAYTREAEPLGVTVQMPDHWMPRGVQAVDVQTEANGHTWAYLPQIAKESPVFLEQNQTFNEHPQAGSATSDHTLTDDCWHITFDPTNGVLQDMKSADQQDALVDLNSGFANLTVFDVHGLLEKPLPGEMYTDHQMVPHDVCWKSCDRTITGPLVSEIMRHGIVPLPEGDQEVSQQWRLLHRDGILEIETIWQKLPRMQREAAYLTLPLNFERPNVIIDQGMTLAEVGREELPGCFRDQYSVHDWVAVAGVSNTLLVATREAGMVEVDRVRFHEYNTSAFTPQTGSLYFLLTHNCCPTNCPRWQEGVLTFTIRLQVHSSGLSHDLLRNVGRRLAWPVHLSHPQTIHVDLSSTDHSSVCQHV